MEKMEKPSSGLHNIGIGMFVLFILCILGWFFEGVFYFFEPLGIGYAFEIILTIFFGCFLLLWLVNRLVKIINSIFKFFGKKPDLNKNYPEDIAQTKMLIMFSPIFLIGLYLVIILLYWLVVKLILENPTLGNATSIINDFETVKESYSYYISSFKQKPITTLLISGGIVFIWSVVMTKITKEYLNEEE